jgi:hypothetical protein
MWRTLFGIACVLCVARRVDAQTSAARGEALFKQGLELRTAGKLAEACDAFDASEKADPNLGTLMNLADCREMINQLATASGFFLEAEKRTRYATDDEGKLINQAAKDRAALLEPRLSRFKLVVPPASRIDGLEILVSKEPFPASSWNLEVPIDGKAHTIIVRAPGHIEWTTEIDVAVEQDRKSVEVPVLERAPDPPPLSPTTTTVIVQRSDGKRLLMSALPFVLVGVGVGAIGTGIAFESWSGSNYDAAKLEPEDARQTHLWERAKSQRAKAIGLTAGGLALAGTAVWLWLRRSAEPPPDRLPAATALSPVVGPSFTGLVIGGGW